MASRNTLHPSIQKRICCFVLELILEMWCYIDVKTDWDTNILLKDVPSIDLNKSRIKRSIIITFSFKDDFLPKFFFQSRFLFQNRFFKQICIFIPNFKIKFFSSVESFFQFKKYSKWKKLKKFSKLKRQKHLCKEMGRRWKKLGDRPKQGQ